jgi:hypothetical protein
MSFTPEVRQAAYKARRARANEGVADLAPLIKELRATGITSLNAITATLDARGVPTPVGHGHWHAMQVARLLKRLAA